MPKVIDVKVTGIFGDFPSDPSASINVEGRLFGVVFDGVKEEESDIFMFPDGPITVRNGKVEPINMDGVAFTLINPTFDPPGLAGKSLRFGGSLTVTDTGEAFGEGFDTVDTFTHTDIGGEHPHFVRISSGGREIRVDFILKVTTNF